MHDQATRLEEEVVRTFRRESQFADQPRTPASRRVGALLVLLAGIALGSGTAFLAGQAQSAQERNRLIEAASEDRQIEAARAALAEEAYKRAKTSFETGVVGRESLMAAEADLRRVRQRIEHLDLDIAEIRATAAPPRNELWAPLVGGRDFVSERLKLEATAGDQALGGAEQRLRDADRLVRLGVAGSGELAAAEADVRDARQMMALSVKRLDLRRRFLEQRLGIEAIARELKRFELEAEVERAAANLRLAQDRAALANSGKVRGIVSEIDARRAELEALELSAMLKRLRAALDGIEKQN